MFEQATAFNEPIGDWNTASVSGTRIRRRSSAYGDVRVHAAPRMESHQAVRRLVAATGVRTETAGPAFAAFHGLESSLAASSGPACASKGHRDSRPARCFAGCRHRGTVALISAPSTSQVLR
jgi:hypothetical protein